MKRDNILALDSVSSVLQFISGKYSGMSHELDPNFAKCQCMLEVSMCWRERRGEGDISSDKLNGGGSIPDRLGIQLWEYEQRHKIPESPFPRKVSSLAFPRQRILELPGNLPCVQLSRTNRLMAIVSPVGV